MDYGILEKPSNVHFDDLINICKQHFGEPRKGKGSHSYIFKTGFKDDPIINLQPVKGKKEWLSLIKYVK